MENEADMSEARGGDGEGEKCMHCNACNRGVDSGDSDCENTHSPIPLLLHTITTYYVVHSTTYVVLHWYVHTTTYIVCI